MTSPKRRKQIHARQHRREKYRKNPELRPRKPTASTEQRAAAARAAEEKSVLSVYNIHLQKMGSPKIGMNELRRWLSVPENQRDSIYEQFKGKANGSEPEIVELCKKTGLSVDMINKLSRLG